MPHLTAPDGAVDAIETIPVITPASSDNTPISPTEAARQLASHRWKRDNPEEAKAQEAKTPAAPTEAAAETELAETPTGDQPQADPAETTKEAEPALPIIEPPRSWTKEEKEEFATYPHEAQEKIARREQERETALRRSQNEAAEQRKATEAERGKAEQARQQYESALPALLQTLQEQQQGEFSDIKTMADVRKLAEEDWPRYAKWDAQQKQVAAVSSEVKAAQERQQSEYRAKWTAYESEQDKKLLDAMPEFAEKSKQTQIADSVIATLEKTGFTRDEFAKAWTGEASISPRDHRWQQVMIKAALYDEAKTNSAKVAPKPVPPVQRPGVSKAPVSANDAEVQTLEKRFERSGSLKDAAALRLARQKARA